MNKLIQAVREFFATSPCPEDMEGFFEALEREAEAKQRDERADFEAWVLTRKVCTHKGGHIRKDRAGNYLDYRINDRWLTWQARAALDGAA